jgi:ATP/maltotriose-dependent transcriptional regulator MalT
MNTPLLNTKRSIPNLPDNTILRKELISRMNAGLGRQLTLIAAPAGSGKTTFVSSWARNLKNYKNIYPSWEGIFSLILIGLTGFWLYRQNIRKA